MLIDILLLFVCILLGIVCALYVSVIGFSIMALGFVIVLGFIIPGHYTSMRFWMQFGAFVCMQLGYFMGILLTALAVKTGHLADLEEKQNNYGTDDRNISTYLDKVL